MIFHILIERREEKCNKITNKKRNIESNQEKLSEIWRIDIFSNWETHWDYKNHRPKNFS